MNQFALVTLLIFGLLTPLFSLDPHEALIERTLARLSKNHASILNEYLQELDGLEARERCERIHLLALIAREGYTGEEIGSFSQFLGTEAWDADDLRRTVALYLIIGRHPIETGDRTPLDLLSTIRARFSPGGRRALAGLLDRKTTLRPHAYFFLEYAAGSLAENPSWPIHESVFLNLVERLNGIELLHPAILEQVAARMKIKKTGLLSVLEILETIVGLEGATRRHLYIHGVLESLQTAPDEKSLLAHLKNLAWRLARHPVF